MTTRCRGGIRVMLVMPLPVVASAVAIGAVDTDRAGGRDCDGTCCDQAPMRSLPVRSAHLDVHRLVDDRSTARTPKPRGQS
jgi:hypothetical protein